MADLVTERLSKIVDDLGKGKVTMTDVLWLLKAVHAQHVCLTEIARALDAPHPEAIIARIKKLTGSSKTSSSAQAPG